MRTRIKNVSPGDRHFSFIPPHGRTLLQGRQMLVRGDLRTDLASGMNRYNRHAELAALDAALAGLDIEYEQLDDSYLFGVAVYDLGDPEITDISFGLPGMIKWIEKGKLPVGSILQSVEVDVTLEAMSTPNNDTWVNDLSIYFDLSPETPGVNAVGQIGGTDPLGNVPLVDHISWNGGDTGVLGSRLHDTKIAGLHFPAGQDLHDMQVSLANGWVGSAGWAGLAIIRYAYPPITPSSSSSSTPSSSSSSTP
jgi:hypothetical protein